MSPAPLRKIIHVDMDAFFASVEQRDCPELRGRPVAVGFAGPRGVVAAASYEARVFGVRSAMPSSTALRKCPDLIFVPPRFDRYKAVSAQIRAIFLDYTSLVEPLSLDEAYLDVTENLRGLPSATATAEEIRNRIRQETELTASAGISYNKLLAKLGSDHNKPDGQFIITPAQGPGFVATLPIGRFHGIGPSTARKMNALGIFTGADLRRQSADFLQQHFGKSGRWYHDIARAVDERPVSPDRQRKSSGAETTFAHDLTQPVEIEEAVKRVAADAWSRCERTGARGRSVTVKVKYADFTLTTRTKTVEGPIGSADRLVSLAIDLVRGLYPPPRPIRLLGVTMHNLVSAEAPLPADQLTFDL